MATFQVHALALETHPEDLVMSILSKIYEEAILSGFVTSQNDHGLKIAIMS